MGSFNAADILLPRAADMEKWSVVACDQYTSQPEYWAETDSIVGTADSTLRLILPEVYLEENDVEDRIDSIHRTMDSYLEKGTFKEYKNALIYIERIQSDGKMRAGLVGAVDLEQYDFHKGSGSAIRATEATVPERIPPRVRVRRGAALELPHIMILIDDVERSIIEPLSNKKDSFQKLYSFPLMQGGGSIQGWLLDDETRDETLEKLESFGTQEAFEARYGLTGTAPLTFAMGDGNHSLATAKAFYEELKAQHPGEDLSQHPARYALTEIVNLHSPALEFEAIHRIVKGVDEMHFICEAAVALNLSGNESDQYISIIKGGMERKFYIQNPTSKLAVGSLQNFLDEYIAKYGGRVDYIHGADTVRMLAGKDGIVGFLLPDMGKDELFPTVIEDGALPRKTFSMGHAEDKRFYLEARAIR